MEACRRKRIERAPEEVAVLGVHDDKILCELCDPPMSNHVIPDPKRAGYEAAALLKRMMDGERPRKAERKPRLIPPIGYFRSSVDRCSGDSRRENRPSVEIHKGACLRGNQCGGCVEELPHGSYSIGT